MRWLCGALVAASLPLSGWNYFSHVSGHGPFHARRAEIEGLMNVSNAIATYSRSVGWKKTTFSVNVTSDTMNGRVVSVTWFEKTGNLQQYYHLLGRRHFAVTREQVFEQLSHTDVLVMDDLSPRSCEGHIHPFFSSIVPLHHDISRWAANHLVFLMQTPSSHGRGYIPSGR
jgi:hypothetical protein